MPAGRHNKNCPGAEAGFAGCCRFTYYPSAICQPSLLFYAETGSHFKSPALTYLCSMNLFRVIIELFVFYMIYKLIFDFIIPVYNTTKQVKKQFGDMQSKMQEQMNQQQHAQTSYTKEETKQRPGKNDDYIDFEEVR